MRLCGDGWLMLCRNFDEAVRLMQRATTIPKNSKVDYYNDVSAAFVAGDSTAVRPL